MLNNEFNNIKETLFQEFEKLKCEYFYHILIKLIKVYQFLLSL